MAAVAGLAACSSNATGALPPAARLSREAGGTIPIRHVVIVIQENRSFDNFFATFPGADGTTTGSAAAMSADVQSACKAAGQQVIAKPTTIPLTKVSLIGAGFPKNFGEGADLDHIHTGFRLDEDGGKMDGWDLSEFGPDGSGTPTCTYTYQYVDPNDIAPYWDMAQQYVLADHTFQTQGSGSFTAHQDLIAGGTQISDTEALIDNPSYFPWGCDANKSVVTAVIKKGSDKVYPFGGPFPCLEYPTLRDLLDAKSVSWKFYAMPVQKVTGCEHGDTAGIWSAFDAIKAVRYSPEWQRNVTRSNLRFFKDVSDNELPAVSWITPDGLNSDHPGERKHPPCKSGGPLMDTGPSWVASIVNAVGESAYWKSTAIVVVWDDWGGFYDHLKPPSPRNWQGGPGFRVPMLIVAPYVKPHVEHTVYQFGSILHFVEDLWDLGSLGNNDAATSIGTAFDFNMKPRKFQKIASKYSREYFLRQPPSGIAPDTE
ncbi:MAG TPA: alkaline phosphatase family protein [Candidatus Binatia bacterium]|nr:alkaline phosphatase family protein [Candidatus Binatia bacterium]